MNSEILTIVTDAVSPVLAVLQESFWKKLDFWIFFCLGLAGLLFSFLAFLEARQAKRAARDAGQVVKIQSVLIDLTELGQKINRLDPNIRFNDARDLLTETSSKIRRIVSPFNQDDELRTTINNLLGALDRAQAALNSVRPTAPDSESSAPQAVFYGIQENFSFISNLVAELLGLFEGRNFQMVRM